MICAVAETAASRAALAFLTAPAAALVSARWAATSAATLFFTVTNAFSAFVRVLDTVPA